MKFYFVALFLIVANTFGCAHSKEAEKAPVEIGTKMTDETYAALIAKNTRHDIKYDGFYNKYEVNATFFNSDTQASILQKKSEVYQWDQKQAQAEREKLFQENSNQTRFELSFFIPNMKLNDLHKGTSIWKIYLEAGGQRYEGKAMKNNGKLEDIRAIYPHHNRWSVAYDVTFNVPLSAIEKGPVTFIVTSTQGTVTLKY